MDFFAIIIVLLCILIIIYTCYKNNQLTTNLQEKIEQNVYLDKQIAILHNELQHKEQKLSEKNYEISKYEKQLNDQLTFTKEMEKYLSDNFKALSSDALSQNNKNFLDLATSKFETLYKQTTADFQNSKENITKTIQPIKELLSTFDNKIHDLEKARVGAYESLKQQIHTMVETQQNLTKETNNLTSALRNPNVRGRWGEVQLKRVVELAGMIKYCDFNEQVTISDTTNDSTIRPDMIIHLPNQKQILIDAKAPMDKYLQAINTNETTEKEQLLTDYAKDIRTTVMKLAQKKYWKNLNAPEFVILFLPGDIFFSTALERDFTLIDDAMENKVLIASPTILMTLLNVIANNWKQENSYNNIKQIMDLNKQLYDRICAMTTHFGKLGKAIQTSTNSYNDTLTQFNQKVLVTAKQLKEITQDKHEIPTIEHLQINDLTDYKKLIMKKN